MAGIEELTREAAKLPKERCLPLVRALLDLGPTDRVAEAEQSWDDEIRARIKAVNEGRATGIAFEDLTREMNRRYRSRLRQPS